MSEQQPLSDGHSAVDTAALEQEGLDWYDRWRRRIHSWLADNVDSNLAAIIMLVPDFFMLIIDLMRDARVPLRVKAQLGIALAYVISPVDFMPEAVLGVIGLADDAGIMALALYSLTSMRKIDLAIVQENWRGEGDVLETINNAYSLIEKNAETLLGFGIWERLKRRFAGQEKAAADSTSSEA